MIADALRIEIEAHAARVRVGNPLLQRAAQGNVPPEAIGRYLASLRYLIGYTPVCLTRARVRAAAGGQHALADHLRHKGVEEKGHDSWAEHDLKVFRNRYGIDPDRRPVPAIAALVRFLEETIEREPVLYLAYILWAEYFPVLAGGEFVQYMVERCGLPPEALSCLATHVELDRDHTEEGVEVIDQLVEDPRLIGEMRQVVRTSMAYFDLACQEMLELRCAELSDQQASC